MSYYELQNIESFNGGSIENNNIQDIALEESIFPEPIREEVRTPIRENISKRRPRDNIKVPKSKVEQLKLPKVERNEETKLELEPEVEPEEEEEVDIDYNEYMEMMNELKNIKIDLRKNLKRRNQEPPMGEEVVY